METKIDTKYQRTNSTKLFRCRGKHSVCTEMHKITTKVNFQSMKFLDWKNVGETKRRKENAVKKFSPRDTFGKAIAQSQWTASRHGNNKVNEDNFWYICHGPSWQWSKRSIKVFLKSFLLWSLMYSIMVLHSQSQSQSQRDTSIHPTSVTSQEMLVSSSSLSKRKLFCRISTRFRQHRLKKVKVIRI